MALKITLTSGDEHVVDFNHESTITVSNRVQIEPGIVADQAQSWSDVKSVSTVADKKPKSNDGE